MVKTALLKEGNTYSIHLVDPVGDGAMPKAEEHNNNLLSTSMPKLADTADKKVAKFVSFTSVFRDGFSLSYSNESIKAPAHKEPTPSPITPRLDQSQISLNLDHKSEERDTSRDAKEKGKKTSSKKGGKKDTTPEPTVRSLINSLF